MCSVVSDSLRPLDHNLPGSSVHRTFQARMLEWIAIFYSRRSSWPRDLTHISCISCLGRQVPYHWVTWEARDQVHRGKSTLCSLTQSFESYLRHVLCYPSLVWKRMPEWFWILFAFHRETVKRGVLRPHDCLFFEERLNPVKGRGIREDDQWQTELVNFYS